MTGVSVWAVTGVSLWAVTDVSVWAVNDVSVWAVTGFFQIKSNVNDKNKQYKTHNHIDLYI